MNSLIGKKFTRLLVIGRIGSIDGKIMWKCLCDCGNKVEVSTGALNGYKKSCGCLNTDTRRKNALSMGKKNKKKLKDRFFSFVEKTEYCWNWIGDIGVGGYGRIWHNGKTVKAHRLSYIKFKGKIPKGILVCHKCDNPKCVNPDHLFLGTEKDNTDDRDNKDRQARGSCHGMSKFTDKDIIEIKTLLLKNITISEIAKIYAVDWGTIKNIKSGKTWKHIILSMV